MEYHSAGEVRAVALDKLYSITLPKWVVRKALNRLVMEAKVGRRKFATRHFQLYSWWEKHFGGVDLYELEGRRLDLLVDELKYRGFTIEDYSSEVRW
jgi:hypothetical protein